MPVYRIGPDIIVAEDAIDALDQINVKTDSMQPYTMDIICEIPDNDSLAITTPQGCTPMGAIFTGTQWVARAAEWATLGPGILCSEVTH